MANKPINRYLLNRDRLLCILKSKGLNIRALGRDSNFKWNEKTIRRAFKDGASYSLLLDLASHLNTDVSELAGEWINVSEHKNVNDISTLYFVSLLVEGKSKIPTKIALYDSETTFSSAIKTLLRTKERYNTFSAWIDAYSSLGKETVFYQCYI